MPRPKNKQKSEQLFDDTFEAEDKLKINKSFAGNYEEKKRKQELSRARDLGIDLAADVDSEDEESEDEGELLTKTIDMGILKTIQAIRKKDPAIYNPEKHFFNAEPESSEEEHMNKPKSQKKVTAKDVLRAQLLDAAASGRSDAFADEDDEGVDESLRKTRLREESRAAKIYNKEQADIRQAFLNTLEGDSVSASSDEDDAGLKKKRYRKVSPEADASDSEDLPQVSRDELRKYLQSKNSSAIAEHGEEIADPDKFLEAFVASRAWHEDSDNDEERFDVPDEVDEAEVDKADEFEAQYNFRYEEPGGANIVSYPRVVEESLRRKDTKRKEERDRKKDRKESERETIAAETKRLMNVKRAELKSRVQKIRDVAGNGVDFDALATAFADELDKDFDPAAYDAKMAALFGDDYYGEAEAEAAPIMSAGAVVEDEDDIDADDGIAEWVFGDGERPKWAGPSAEALADGRDGFEDLFGATSAAEAHDSEAEVEDDEAYDPAVSGFRKQKHKRKSKSKKLSAVERVKASLAREQAGGVHMDDPDDVLALGFEDIIGGGIKTRFHYKQVPAADYGLEPEDILLADDTDLSSHVGLKRMAPYRDVEWEVPKKQRKRSVKHMRAKMKEELTKLGIRFGEADDAEEEGAAATAEVPVEPEMPVRGDGQKATESSKQHKNRDAEGRDASSGSKRKRHAKKHGENDADREKMVATADGSKMKKARLDTYGF